jgi:membrane-associated phospholipid phosphatase
MQREAALDIRGGFCMLTRVLSIHRAAVMSVIHRFILVATVFAGSVVGGPVVDDVAAQPAHRASYAEAPDPPALDRRALHTIYNIKAPIFRGAMRGADRSAFPVFFGAPIVAWGGVWVTRSGDDWSDAYRLTASQVVTYGAVKGLKTLFQRPRPFVVHPDIQSRSPRYSPSGPEGASFAFPSGHAAMAFAIAASWSLSHPEWYVVAPGALWASSVALSRVWLGVHYPSDVLAGALLGTGLSLGIHLLGAAITPAVFEGETAMPAPAFQLHIRL